MNTLEEDHKSYYKRMENGDSTGALAIEKRYGLDGYPPEIVSLWFVAEIEEAGSGFSAIDARLGEAR